MSTPTRRRIFDEDLYLDEFEPVNKRPSAKSLKPPPEIWELVHPVQQEQFKPTRTFLSRVANRNVMFALLGSVLILGAAAVVWKFRVAQNVWSVLSQPDAPARQSTTATTKRAAPEKPKPAPVAAVPAPAPVETIATTVSEPASSAPVVTPKRIVKKPLKTGVATSFGTTANTIKPIGEKVSSNQSAASEKPASSGSQAPAPQPAKPKPSASANSEAVTPAKTTPTKPKVIQWP